MVMIIDKDDDDDDYDDVKMDGMASLNSSSV